MQQKPNTDEALLTPKERKARFKQGIQDVVLSLQLKTEIQKAMDANIPFDRVAFCEKTGITLEEFEQLIKTLQEKREHWLANISYEVPLLDKQLELTGYPLPSDAIKPHFGCDLQDSNMFEVFEDEETENQFTSITGGAFGKEITECGHIPFVEDLFEEAFDEDIAFTVMNAFFWILYYKGDSWLPVRSYAIEMLKLFPEVIIREYPNPEHFIQAFSNFASKTLSSRGLCALQARPTAWELKNGLYSIKATDAFQYLLEPSEYVMAATLAN